MRRNGRLARDEFAFDRPFLWGSKARPGLHRIGRRYSDIWHKVHLLDPRAVVPDSIMPAYPWLGERAADTEGAIQAKMRALRRLGHPYTDADIAAAPAALEGLTEVDALVAYLQGLGTPPAGDAP